MTLPYKTLLGHKNRIKRGELLMKEEYKDFQIEINEVPDIQFDFDGFGWAYQVFNAEDLFFRVVIKANSGNSDNENVQSAYKWGVEKIKSMIEMNKFEMGETYCYRWVTASYLPQEVNCDGFLLGGKE